MLEFGQDHVVLTQTFKNKDPTMPALQFLDLHLQTVTPMACGGADLQPEVRPPSFRGMLRYWLRVLLGGVFGADLGAMRSVENGVFGSTQQKSRFAIRTLDFPSTGPMPVDRAEAPGIGYLYHAIYQAQRHVTLPGEPFRLRLQTLPMVRPPVEVRGQQIDTELLWRLVLAAFWLTIHMGGVGRRVRRGGGNLRFDAELPGWPDPLPAPLLGATTPQAFADDLASALTRLRRAFGWIPVEDITALPAFNLLHPNVCNCYVLDRIYATWHEALNEIGEVFQAFRRRQPEDYEAVKGLLTQRSRMAAGLKRAILGLPIGFFFSSLYRELTAQGVSPQEARRQASATVGPRRGIGRASPLWFRVERLADATPGYVVQMHLFRSRFLPENTMVLRPQNRALRPVNMPTPADFAYVETWFEHVEQTVDRLIPVNFT
jgi:CRISPR-associated protein Cmr1